MLLWSRFARLEVFRRPGAVARRPAVVGASSGRRAFATFAARLAVFARFARLPWRQRGFAALLAKQGLARQLHAVVLVDGDHFHVEHVAYFADILDPTDVFVIQF